MKSYEQIIELAQTLTIEDLRKSTYVTPYLKPPEKDELYTGFYEFHIENIQKILENGHDLASALKIYAQIENKCLELSFENARVRSRINPYAKPFNKMDTFVKDYKQHMDMLLKPSLSKRQDVEKAMPSNKDNQVLIEMIPFSEINKVNDKTLTRILFQLNGCYTHEYADACLVMMRRLLEVILIKLFLKQDLRQTIIKTDPSGHYLNLNGLIKFVLSDDKIKLSSHSRQFISQAKEFGDISAHNPLTCLTIQDIETIRAKYRVLIGELIDQF